MDAAVWRGPRDRIPAGAFGFIFSPPITYALVIVLSTLSDDDDDSYTGGHGVVTAGNLQAWRDGACSRFAVDWCAKARLKALASARRGG